MTALVALAVVIAEDPDEPLSQVLDFQKYIKGKMEDDFIQQKEV